MRFRSGPRLPVPTSEIGVGMWGMGGWSGADDRESNRALDRAVDLGCNFFDTAWAYGDGHSERLLGSLRRRYPRQQLILASKVPPKNLRWPGKAATPADDVFPYQHVVTYTEMTLSNLGVETLDVQQLHVWDDSWTAAHGWRDAIADLKRAGKIRSFGISINRWEPQNVMRVLETGLVDAVQVVYNVFDQAPEDVLFPACQRLGVAVIARVPFDEGSLTGTLSAESRWPDGDWRNTYFAPPYLMDTLPRVAAVAHDAELLGTSLPELALRFILSHPAVTTTIPGMRRVEHVEANVAAAARGPLPVDVIAHLRRHRWNRVPDDRP